MVPEVCSWPRASSTNFEPLYAAIVWSALCKHCISGDSRVSTVGPWSRPTAPGPLDKMSCFYIAACTCVLPARSAVLESLTSLFVPVRDLCIPKSHAYPPISSSTTFSIWNVSEYALNVYRSDLVKSPLLRLCSSDQLTILHHNFFIRAFLRVTSFFQPWLKMPPIKNCKNRFWQRYRCGLRVI